MRLTEALVSRVPPHGGASGRLAGRSGRPTDAEYAEAVACLLAGAPAPDEVWIFAFGSLIWGPGFDHVEERLATLHGLRRSFCIGWVRIYRGTPERPGIMLGLDRGGACRRARCGRPRDRLPGGISGPLGRDPHALDHRANGGVPLAVLTSRAHGAYLPGLAEEVVVEALPTAAGERGSMAEYLRTTIEHLEARGIHDRYLWRMQQLVAERLERGAGRG